MPKSLDDIFNDDAFGLLDFKENKSVVKSDEDRLIDSFMEINDFFEKNNEFYSGVNTYGYSKFTIINKHKENLIERYMIHDLSHSWSGGDSAYPYNDAQGPDATSFIIEFFKRYGL